MPRLTPDQTETLSVIINNMGQERYRQFLAFRFTQDEDLDRISANVAFNTRATQCVSFFDQAGRSFEHVEKLQGYLREHLSGREELITRLETVLADLRPPAVALRLIVVLGEPNGAASPECT